MAWAWGEHGVRSAVNLHITLTPVCCCLPADMAMLGRGSVLHRASAGPSTSAPAALCAPPRQARRQLSKAACAALVTEPPRTKAVEGQNGNGKLGMEGPTIMNGQVLLP